MKLQEVDIAVLSLSLLGPITLEVDDRPFNGLRIRPALALLIYLVCQPERHRRERLMEVLWPGWLPTAAQQNLRQNLYVIRQALPAVAAREGNDPVPLILAERETLQLNPMAAVAVDVHHFRALLDQRQPTPPQLAEAEALYRGDFLADFYLPDSNVFEEWAAARREAYRRLAINALERLVTYYLAQADYDATEGYARRQLAIDGLHESAHRQLMLTLAYRGQRAAAVNLYEAYRRLIRAELGIEPSNDIRALAYRIADNKEAFVPPEKPATPDETTKAFYDNLPSQLTSFVGRQHEMVEAAELLRKPDTRLLTLTGVGGVGKTRLAIRLAAELKDEFRDGVCFVPLETVLEPSRVVPELMRVLAVKERIGASPLETLQAYLRDRNLLLVLDNFEQIIAAAPEISALLRETSSVKALVTSREALRIAGERDFPVPSLGLPPERPAVAATWVESESVELFVQRARAARSGFALNDANAADIAAICRKLDGLPLALELAAARLRLLSPAQLLSRLDSRLGLLTTGARDAAGRHQTLRGMIDWSHDLLRPDEQVLFARLGVFTGGWTLEAAETIAADEVVPDVLTGLESLLNKSLIVVREDPAGNVRYGMLETVREYAVAKLKDRGEYDRLAQRHLRYYFELRPGGDFSASGKAQFLRTLWLAEEPNYLAAIEWGSRQTDITAALRLAITHSFVLESHGSYRQALDFALKFRTLPGNVEPLWPAAAIRGQAAGKAIFLREYDLARQLLREALEIDRADHEIEEEFHDLVMLGRVDIEEGLYAAGWEICQQALHFAKEHNIESADFLVAWSGEALLGLGRFGEAVEILGGLATPLNDSGLVWPRRAELELVRGHFGAAIEVLRLGREPVRPRVRIWRNFLIGLVGWLLERPHSEPRDVAIAARLLGVNEMLKERTGDILSAFYRELIERRMALVRQRLSAEEFQAAWDEGLGWSEKEADVAIACVLEREESSPI